MEIICYGCGRGQYLENTIEAFKACKSINPNWWVEIDIQLTKDGQIVLFHDQDMSAFTNTHKRIRDFNYSELKSIQLKLPDHLDNNIQDRSIPLLSDLLSVCQPRKVILDISTDEIFIVQQLKHILSEYHDKIEVMIGSENDHIIKLAKAQIPGVIVGAGAREAKALAASSRLWLDRYFPLHSDALFVPEYLGKIKILTPRLIRHVHAQDKKIYVWKVEQPDATCYNTKEELLRMKALGVDGILSDRPGDLWRSMNPE